MWNWLLSFASFAVFQGWWHSLTHIEVVDVKRDHTLVRMGNLAVYAGHFNWLGWGEPHVSLAQLAAALEGPVHKANPNAGRVEPSGISDICVLTDESDLIEAEKEAFGEAQVTLWPIKGVSPAAFQAECKKVGIDGCTTSMQPRDLERAAVETLAKSFAEWDADELDKRVEDLHTRMTEGADRDSRVFVIHCNCGCDRTGELAIAYEMKFLNHSLTQALVNNKKLIGRHMVYRHQVALQWYCEYLRARGEYGMDDCARCEDDAFRCKDTGTEVDPVFQEWVHSINEWVIVSIFLLVVIVLFISCPCCKRAEDSPFARPAYLDADGAQAPTTRDARPRGAPTSAAVVGSGLEEPLLPSEDPESRGASYAPRGGA